MLLHFAVQQLNWKPTDWLALSFKERAFMIASIKIRLEEEKAERTKMEAKARKK